MINFYQLFEDLENDGLKSTIIPAVLENFIVKTNVESDGSFFTYGLATCHIQYKDGSDEYCNALLKFEEVTFFEHFIGSEVILKIIVEGELSGNAYVEKYCNRSNFYLNNYKIENENVIKDNRYLNYFNDYLFEDNFQMLEIDDSDFENQNLFSDYIDILLEIDQETYLEANLQAKNENLKPLKIIPRYNNKETPLRVWVILLTVLFLTWFIPDFIHSGGEVSEGFVGVLHNLILIPIAVLVIYIAIQLTKSISR